MTKAEQETVVRWDQRERVVHLSTSYQPDAKSWARRGYRVEIAVRAESGEPIGWKTKAPLKAIRLRKLQDGKLVSRPRGRSFGVRGRKLAETEVMNVVDEGLSHRARQESSTNAN